MGDGERRRILSQVHFKLIPLIRTVISWILVVLSESYMHIFLSIDELLLYN